jgi:hypothetical protein
MYLIMRRAIYRAERDAMFQGFAMTLQDKREREEAGSDDEARGAAEDINV